MHGPMNIKLTILGKRITAIEYKRSAAPSTKKTWRGSLPIDMLLSAMSILVVAQSSSEIPEGLTNNLVQWSALILPHESPLYSYKIRGWPRRSN